MSAIQVLLADAVTTALNAAVAASSLTALTETEQETLQVRRSYPDWDDDFKDLKDLAVDVVFVSSAGSGGELAELDSAGSISVEPAVDVAVRYRFQAADKEANGRLKNTSVDRLVLLVEELYLELASNRAQELSITGLSANWVDCTLRTLCDYGRLRQGAFMGVIRVRYNASRAT